MDEQAQPEANHSLEKLRLRRDEQCKVDEQFLRDHHHADIFFPGLFDELTDLIYWQRPLNDSETWIRRSFRNTLTMTLNSRFDADLAVVPAGWYSDRDLLLSDYERQDGLEKRTRLLKSPLIQRLSKLRR